MFVWNADGPRAEYTLHQHYGLDAAIGERDHAFAAAPLRCPSASLGLMRCAQEVSCSSSGGLYAHHGSRTDVDLIKTGYMEMLHCVCAPEVRACIRVGLEGQQLWMKWKKSLHQHRHRRMLLPQSSWEYDITATVFAAVPEAGLRR